MEGDQILLLFACITPDEEMKLTSVGLPVPIWETSNGGDFLNSIPADSSSSNLIFLKNTLSSHKFQVDTGASVTVSLINLANPVLLVLDHRHLVLVR